MFNFFKRKNKKDKNKKDKNKEQQSAISQDASSQEEVNQEELEESAISQDASLQEEVDQEELEEFAISQDASSQEEINQEELEEYAISQDASSQEETNQEELEESAISQDASSQEETNQEELGESTISQDASSQEETNQEELGEFAISQDASSQEETNQEDQNNKKSWLQKLNLSLKKSSNKLASGIKNIFINQKIDDDMLEELEDLLISSDLGIEITDEIISEISKNKFDQEITQEEIKEYIVSIIESKVGSVTNDPVLDKKPNVILVCGVNGNGKTTSSGKLAYKYSKEGYKVMLVACDTFRAAAIEQLHVWSKRANCTFFYQDNIKDPASVAYSATKKAKEENFDYIIIDTAGRLQNKINLMNELKKIDNVIKKIIPEAPHETILVIDGTTGQNANIQVEKFIEFIPLTGLIVTKLDGSAKAGAVIGIMYKFNIPVRYIGIGESVNDMQKFNIKEFSNNLLDIDSII